MRLPTKPSHTPACTPTLPMRLGDGHGGGHHVVGGLLGAHDLEQPHDVGGREEVQPHHVLRPLGHGGDVVDVERGGVGGDDGARLGDFVELLEHLLLERHVLEHGLDDQVGLAEVLHLQRRRELGEAVGRLRFGDAPALGVGRQRILDAIDAAVERLLRGLDDGHGEAAVEEGQARCRCPWCRRRGCRPSRRRAAWCRRRCPAGWRPGARRRRRTAAPARRGSPPPRGTAGARAHCPRRAAGWSPPPPRRWRPWARSARSDAARCDARAFSNRPAGIEALSIFFSPMRRGGLPICSLAKATAAATTSPSATLSIRPAAAPLAASMNAPVVIICRACSTPTARGSRCVPPAPGMMPSLISGSPSWRTSLAATR